MAILVLWMIAIEKRATDWMLPKKASEQVLIPIDLSEKPRDEDSQSRRIVETEQGESTKTPEKEAYLGKQNQTVSRETVSRGGKISSGAPKAPSQKRATSQSLRTGKGATLSHLGVPLFSKDSLNALTRPQPEQPRWASDGASVNVPRDYIDGVKESERTALNTREYIFFGYFQRIRERLDLAWTSTLRARLEKLYRRGRRLASEQDLKTRTWVTLDAQGKVVRVRLIEESGVLDLDEAAVAAFNDAGPFPNPPKGLINEQGQIELHWDFVLRN